MNINQKAQELAKLIKTTDEFQTMNKYKREIEKNNHLKCIISVISIVLVRLIYIHFA